MVECTACGHLNTADSRFCSQCGEKLPQLSGDTTHTIPVVVDDGRPRTEVSTEIQEAIQDLPHGNALLLVAGDHALNDILGDEEDSVINTLKRAGYEVEGQPIGLGARAPIRKLYLQHLDDALNFRFLR